MERQEKNIDLSAEEMMNLSSYSTDQQLKVYDTTKLKSVEVPVFEKYFNVGQKKKVLDIGIGGGRTTGYLIDYGHEVTGIDLSDKMVELAQKKYPGSDVRVMNATQLDFPDNNFDIVLFSFNGIDCIYPEEKRFQALMEAHRVLKSGGLFILSSHNSIIIPKTKYDWFWWLVNIITLRIFGAYRLEYKQFHKGVKFVYFHRRPSRQVEDFKMAGFELVEIFVDPKQKFLLNKMKDKRKWFWVDLLSPWPYFILRKK